MSPPSSADMVETGGFAKNGPDDLSNHLQYDNSAINDCNDSPTQHGVQQMEAITAVWSKSALVTVYLLMFLIYFVNAFQSSITSNLSPYITSDFAEHSLIPAIAIVSSVVSAATYMPVAKLLNVADRSYAFGLMAVLATLGLVTSAVCNNIATYCASQVFYSIGFVGMILCVDVITADTSSLRSRGLAYAFTSSPYVITAFAGSVASQGFYEDNWRWGFGTFAIVLPVVALPLFAILQYNKQKAKKLGLIVREVSGKSWSESIIFHVIDFDLLGVFLLAAGLALFLLPFSLAQTYADSYNSTPIIVMLVMGVATLVSFVLVEKFVSAKPFIPFRLLRSRTVIGACLLDFTYQIAYYCWDGYFTSYLQVVYNTSISTAGYISSTFDVVNGVWLLVVGLLIRRTGYFKWLLLISIPIYMLGVGLMIYFRQPDKSLGYIVMCQIFIAIGGGAFIICEQVAVLAAGSHNDAASLLALLGLFGYIGGAVGSAISGAIWTGTLPSALQRYLPEETAADWQDIYDSLDVQLSYPVGDPTRDAIINAYADAQTRMLIAGTVVMVFSLGAILLIKNIKLSAIEQVKGLVL